LRQTSPTIHIEGTMLKLHINPSQGPPFERLFEGDAMIFGRASDCDLVIEDRFLSRHHSCPYRDGDRLLLKDVGSRNGTMLNGSVIDQPTEVKPGDVIKISGSTVSLRALHEVVPLTTDLASELGPNTIFKSASSLLGEAAEQSLQGDAKSLRRYAERLELLNDVHRALGQSMELGDLLELILDRVFDHLKPEQGAIFLKRGDDDYQQAAVRARPGVQHRAFYSRSLVREVSEKGVAALVYDVENDERFADAKSLLLTGIRSLVAAPLLDPKGNLGMIVLNASGGRRFSHEDMELLVSVASVAALSLRNVALAEEAAERLRMEKELKLGRRIQKALLPDRLPEVPGFDLYGRNLPFHGVSGDFYQVLERNEGTECVLVVADVSGKGIAASLLTASLEALAAGPIEDGQAPEVICDALSRRLHRRTPPEKYATAFLAVLKPTSGHLCYTNAGHNPGLLMRADGTVQWLASTGPPIGLLPSASFAAGEVDLSPGDLLVLYTDGITEAANAAEEEYGEQRLAEVCRQHRTETLDQVALAIRDNLVDFVGDIPFADDRTLVMARRAEE
jgi:serine phosphatase RsbU (regulator of sigma subunit)